MTCPRDALTSLRALHTLNPEGGLSEACTAWTGLLGPEEAVLSPVTPQCPSRRDGAQVTDKLGALMYLNFKEIRNFAFGLELMGVSL